MGQKELSNRQEFDTDAFQESVSLQLHTISVFANGFNLVSRYAPIKPFHSKYHNLDFIKPFWTFKAHEVNIAA